MANEDQQTADEELFARWTREHAQAVRGYLLGMVRRSDVAEDLAQDVFLRAWKARRRYREQGTPRAYLLRIADRLVFDRYRKAGRETTVGEESWKHLQPTTRDAGPAEELTKKEAAEQLTAALEKLSDMQRRILLLRFYGQLSFAEIAETVDCPLNTALSHCRRGLLAMQELLIEKNP
jgi:RNA polymerase sigma-70 factor (ECF subfamily)